jgi:protein involved in sex pheromone biosynthesis
MRKFLLMLMILMISACTAIEIEPANMILNAINQDDYRLVIPFTSSPTRQYHGIYLGRTDFIEVGLRLEQKSKQHFSVTDYFLAEGQILDNARLGRLVRRESTENPYGLNPPTGSLFDLGNGQTVENAVVVANVVELNFMQGSPNDLRLAGISLAIVLNQTLSGGQTISEERLYEYGASMGRKLDRFIRTITGLEDIPLYIALYSTNRSDATLPGRYIGEGFFTARGGQFSPNQERWVLFPSSEAASLDPNLSNQFNAFRSEVTRFIPESVGVIAEARYVNEEIHHMRITLTIQAKTYTEAHALTQLAATRIAEFVPNNFRIIVRINSINETLALVERSTSNEITIIYTY